LLGGVSLKVGGQYGIGVKTEKTKNGGGGKEEKKKGGEEGDDPKTKVLRPTQRR